MSTIGESIGRTMRRAADYFRGQETKPALDKEPPKAPDGVKEALERGRIHDVTRQSDGRVELKATDYPEKAKVTMTPGRGGGAPNFEAETPSGERRPLTAEEKQVLATNLDRVITTHDLPGEEEEAAKEMLRGLAQDFDVDARWHAPNLLKDLALKEGRLSDVRNYEQGQALGRKSGPMTELLLSNGNSAEATVYRESAPNGKGSTPLFSKSRDDGHLVALSKEEAVALRDNLLSQKGVDRTLTRDLDRYIRSLDPYAAGDTYETCSH